MAPVVCAVSAPMSREVVQAAVLFCLDRGADLRLVGVVEGKLTNSSRATGGERVGRYKHTRQELDRAAETARAAGVVATTTIRAGDLAEEAVREAEAVDASDLFRTHSGSRSGRLDEEAARRNGTRDSHHVVRRKAGESGLEARAHQLFERRRN